MSCPHQMPAVVEARIVELRRLHPGWGPRMILFRLEAERVVPLPGRSSIYRCLVRHGLIEAEAPRRKKADYKRWERSRSMELWQMDVAGSKIVPVRRSQRPWNAAWVSCSSARRDPRHRRATAPRASQVVREPSDCVVWLSVQAMHLQCGCADGSPEPAVVIGEAGNASHLTFTVGRTFGSLMHTAASTARARSARISSTTARNTARQAATRTEPIGTPCWSATLAT